MNQVGQLLCAQTLPVPGHIFHPQQDQRADPNAVELGTVRAGARRGAPPGKLERVRSLFEVVQVKDVLSPVKLDRYEPEK